MIRIPLTQEEFAIIDDKNYPIICGYKWHCYINRAGNKYAIGYKNRVECDVRMHRLILGLKTGDGKDVDHIDGNGLDNQEHNLRVVTRTQNCMNSRKRDNTSSKYKVVSLYKRVNKWTAQIWVNRKRIHLGYFSNELDAAHTYDQEAKKHFGEFAKLNFPIN